MAEQYRLRQLPLINPETGQIQPSYAVVMNWVCTHPVDVKDPKASFCEGEERDNLWAEYFIRLPQWKRQHLWQMSYERRNDYFTSVIRLCGRLVSTNRGKYKWALGLENSLGMGCQYWHSQKGMECKREELIADALISAADVLEEKDIPTKIEEIAQKVVTEEGETIDDLAKDKYTCGHFCISRLEDDAREDAGWLLTQANPMFTHPDGRRLLLDEFDQHFEKTTVFAGVLDGGTVAKLIEGGCQKRYKHLPLGKRGWRIADNGHCYKDEFGFYRVFYVWSKTILPAVQGNMFQINPNRGAFPESANDPVWPEGEG